VPLGLAVISVLGFGWPLAAQGIGGRIVIYGRVEDALSLTPLAGVRLISGDSSSAVYSDSVGAFAITLPAGEPLSVFAERFGYDSDRFDLSGDARSQLFVIRMEPAPIEIEGIAAEAEAAISVLVDNLENRRNSFPGAVRVFDRERLDRLAQPGNVYDFLSARMPRLTYCDRDAFKLCVPGRFRSFMISRPQVPVLVCVDEWTSFLPAAELRNISIESVSLVEIFGSEVRIYTTDWMLSRARRQRTRVQPLGMGCSGL
jgi:hypothetical protein